MLKKAISWNQILTDSRRLAEYVEYCDVILALGRGGLVPSTILSHHLDCKVFNFGLKSYIDKESGEIEIIQSPGIKFNSLYREKKVLVVDDLSDKGNTLQFVKDYLDNHDFNFYRFATLYIKKSTKFTPTHYIEEFDDNIWLDFPWETVKLD